MGKSKGSDPVILSYAKHNLQPLWINEENNTHRNISQYYLQKLY